VPQPQRLLLANIRDADEIRDLANHLQLSRVAALFKRAGLSAITHAPLLIALDIWREVARGNRMAGPQEVSWSMLQAAYLAGSLNLHEAIPFLKSLEMSTYSETNSARGHPDGVNFNNEVDPFRYCTYDLRQTAQLSLRRLGVAPRNLPCHRFMIERGDEEFPFTPKKQTQPRHKNATQVKTGMSAKKVLNTIGAPDYIDDDSWSYDMDAEVPFSLTLTFDTYNVTAIKKKGSSLENRTGSGQSFGVLSEISFSVSDRSLEAP